MKLLSLTLDNFKGIRHFEFCPDGRSVVVKAANSAGKTTLQDAYWWLLTGKNANGEAKFDIFPYKKDGTPGEIEPVDVTVTGTFIDAANTSFTLQRILKPKTKKDYSEAVSKVATETVYFIDGILKTKRDYDVFIGDHFGKEIQLWSFSALHYFPTVLNWSDRRQILIDNFASGVSDADVIDAHKELEPLREDIGAMYTVSDIAQKIKYEMRRVKKELDEKRPRIEEEHRMIPEIPTDADPTLLPTIAKRKAELNIKIASIENGEDIANLRRRIAELEAKAAEARAAYMQETTGGNEALQRQAKELRRKISEAESQMDKIEHFKRADETRLRAVTEERNALRTESKKRRTDEFSGGICKTCGRPFPPEQIEKEREKFNFAKANDLADIRQRGLAKNDEIREIQERIREHEEKSSVCRDRLETLRSHLKELTDSIITPPAWETTTDAKAYAVEIEGKRKQLQQRDLLAKRQLEDAQAQLAEIDAQFAKITSRRDIIKLREKSELRIKELMDEEKKLGIELAKLDQRLQLTERFVQLQAADIENKINSAFTDVRWVLFDRQVNGGTVPCCRAMLLDHNDVYVDYTATNTANAYNGGLHIIDGLSKVTGLQLPVWIDQAESCTNYTQINNQVIRLQVSAEHPEITVEVLA